MRNLFPSEAVNFFGSFCKFKGFVFAQSCFSCINDVFSFNVMLLKKLLSSGAGRSTFAMVVPA